MTLGLVEEDQGFIVTFPGLTVVFLHFYYDYFPSDSRQRERLGAVLSVDY